MQVDLGILPTKVFFLFKLAQFFVRHFYNTMFFQDYSQDYIGEDDIIFIIEVIAI